MILLLPLVSGQVLPWHGENGEGGEAPASREDRPSLAVASHLVIPYVEVTEFISRMKQCLGIWNIQTYRFRPIPLSISPLKGENNRVSSPSRGG